jgi:hypothetical protein
MKRHLAVLAATALLSAPAFADKNEEMIKASRAASKALFDALGGELQAAMKAGGPVNAIQVCNTKAPDIARDVSAKQNLAIGRTSLKLRNEKNAPDAWEAKVLELFELRKKNGEAPATLEFYEAVGGEFRYMKAIAIPEGAPCLACHGVKIDEKVQAKLKELYPKDKATGYSTGDLRGAFTVRIRM